MLSYLLKPFFKPPVRSEFHFHGTIANREYPSPAEEFKRGPGIFVVKAVTYEHATPATPVRWKLSIRTLVLDEVRPSRWFNKPAGGFGLLRGVIPVSDENFAFRVMPNSGFQLTAKRKLQFRKSDRKKLGFARDLTVVVDFYEYRWPF